MKNALSNLVFNSVRLVVVLLLGACASTAATPTPLPAKTSTTIQLNWTYDFGFAGFYAADKNGRFAAQNLDVKLVEGGFKDGKFVDPIQSNIGMTCDDPRLLRDHRYRAEQSWEYFQEQE